jgi:hypothetical protein
LYEGNEPLIEFDKGYIKSWKGGLPNDIKDEIHEKVLELNPTWKGELERLVNQFVEDFHIQKPAGHFTDLAIKPVSGISKSKQLLNNLMIEINEDVFDNSGSIELNVPVILLGGNKLETLFALKESKPPPENIILFHSVVPEYVKKMYQNGRIPSGYFKKNYIGVVENGSYEIRVIVKRDKFNYWDTTIDEIIETLRTAIEWWKTEAKYSQYEIDGMAEAAAFDEAADFMSDMEDYGYTDEDY